MGLNDEECDATKDDSSHADRNKKLKLNFPS